jgi:hypothetical protein
MVIILFAVIDRTRFERVIALFEKRKKLPLYSTTYNTSRAAEVLQVTVIYK